MLALQEELASAIAHEINVQLTPAEQSRLGSAPTVNPEAYDAYLKGRYFFNRPSDENLQKAIARFEEAHRGSSPTFARPLGIVGRLHLGRVQRGVHPGLGREAPRQGRGGAGGRARHSSAEAHTSLATFKLFYEYDWEGSEAEYRRAFELNPNYAFAHDQFALGLAFQGRYDESIAETRLAAELDPLNPQILIDGIFAFAWQGDFEAAKEMAKRAEDLDPTYFFPEFSYGWIDIQAGKALRRHCSPPEIEDDGVAGLCQRLARLRLRGVRGSRPRAGGGRGFEGDVARWQRHSLRQRARRIGLGDYPRAVSLLEQAYALDSQWLGWLKNDHAFDPLRSDPRFATLMKKLNFEE